MLKACIVAVKGSKLEYYAQINKSILALWPLASQRPAVSHPVRNTSLHFRESKDAYMYMLRVRGATLCRPGETVSQKYNVPAFQAPAGLLQGKAAQTAMRWVPGHVTLACRRPVTCWSDLLHMVLMSAAVLQYVCPQTCPVNTRAQSQRRFTSCRKCEYLHSQKAGRRGPCQAAALAVALAEYLPGQSAKFHCRAVRAVHPVGNGCLHYASGAYEVTFAV